MSVKLSREPARRGSSRVKSSGARQSEKTGATQAVVVKEDEQEAEDVDDGSAPMDVESKGLGGTTKGAKQAALSGQAKPEEALEVSTRTVVTVGGKKPKPSVEADANQGTEVSGYNAKRNEFEPEYDADAELPLADMEFKDGDSEADRALKIRMLEVYSRRLDERIRRKRFVVERGLLQVSKCL
jgi:hypothetical protein